MTTVKIHVDKVSLKVLFKAMAKMNDDMNETSFVHSITKRRLQIKAQAQAADFYTPNQSSDTIVLKKGCPWMRDWPDHDLVNTKQGWESLGVINGNLISGAHQDYDGNFYLIPQTMAGIEIELDSDEFQEWYRAFTTFP
jgi:hypothetical protein